MPETKEPTLIEGECLVADSVPRSTVFASLIAVLVLGLLVGGAVMSSHAGSGPHGPALTMVATKDLTNLTADQAKMQASIEAIVKDRNALAGVINAQADELLLLRARVDTLSQRTPIIGGAGE